MRVLILAASLIFTLVVPSISYSQEQTPKFEVGAQFSTINFNGVQEKPAGLGARFHYNFSKRLAADAEVTHYPQNTAGDFGETTGLFGIRAGQRWERFGVFARARAGFLYLGGADRNLRLTRKVFPSLDFGGPTEYYASRRLLLRLEASDVIVPYDNATVLLNFGTTRRLGTRHNLATSLGFAIRF